MVAANVDAPLPLVGKECCHAGEEIAIPLPPRSTTPLVLVEVVLEKVVVVVVDGILSRWN